MSTLRRKKERDRTYKHENTMGTLMNNLYVCSLLEASASCKMFERWVLENGD